MSCPLCGSCAGSQSELSLDLGRGRPLRALIRELLSAAGPQGLTADELQRSLKRSQQSVSGRLSSMRKRGQVLFTGIKRQTRAGALARAFTLAPEAEGLAR